MGDPKNFAQNGEGDRKGAIFHGVGRFVIVSIMKTTHFLERVDNYDYYGRGFCNIPHSEFYSGKLLLSHRTRVSACREISVITVFFSSFH